jgi:hypothetical protein
LIGSSCYNIARRVKHLDNGLTIMPVSCTSVVFSFLSIDCMMDVSCMELYNNFEACLSKVHVVDTYNGQQLEAINEENQQLQ